MSTVRNIVLKPKQRNVALLSALLYTPQDIAAETGYSVQYIQQMLRRSDVRDLVRRYEEDRMAQRKTAVMDEIMADAPTNLKRIKEIRESNMTEDPRVSLSAATLLFDRQVPKTLKHEEEKHIHIHLTRDEVADGRAVLEELRTLEHRDYALEES